MIDARLREITSRVVSEYRKIFGDALVQVILYDSYARGDFDDKSDIDIVALVRCNRETISNKTYAMAEFSSDLDLTFGIMFSPLRCLMTSINVITTLPPIIRTSPVRVVELIA